MASIFLSVVFTSLVVSVLIGNGCDAIGINITPDTCISSMGEKVQISCTSEGDSDRTKQITLMEIAKDNGDPIVFLRDCSNVTLPSNASSGLKVEGNISKHFIGSSLNLTLLNPKPEDSGVYTCALFYINATGRLTEERRTWNLFVQNEMNDRFVALESKTSQLDETAAYISAFSATTNNTVITTWKGKTLVLPDMIMAKGHSGYNPETGVFTAPRDGLYVFHVVAFGNINCISYLELRAKGQAVARLNMYDKIHWDQSSMSSVVDLQAGNAVFIRMLRDYCRVHKGMYTVFTGYMIKAY